MNKNWVEFKTIKQAVTIQMVLDHYSINWLRKSGKEFRGRCPIHSGGGASVTGEKGSASFQANFDKNAFNCFSCDAQGNVLDFVAAMEKCSVRDAGLKLQQWFPISGGPAPEQNKIPSKEIMAGVKLLGSDESRGEENAQNPPLAFQLKGVEAAHSYLIERGITRATTETFGAGFFSGKGSMSGRIVIPIHNERGELVAYSGRAIDEMEPKYKFPAGFRKSLELFNLERVKARPWGNELDGLVVVVEGFFDCMKVWQAGVPVVALMGCSLSDRQEQFIAENFVEVLLMLDGDAAGREAAAQIAARLAKKVWVKDLVLTEGKQPDQFSTAELNELLNEAL